jgi:hypothetical protein
MLTTIMGEEHCQISRAPPHLSSISFSADGVCVLVSVLVLGSGAAALRRQ